MSTQTFTLPDVGEGLTEAEIVTWKSRPATRSRSTTCICEIETAKSLVELPSPHAGVVGELLVAEGKTVDVGTPIITFLTAGGRAAAGRAGLGSGGPRRGGGIADRSSSVRIRARGHLAPPPPGRAPGALDAWA